MRSLLIFQTVRIFTFPAQHESAKLTALGGISNFFSQLIVSFGYTPEQSLLYGTPGGAVEVVFLIACGWAGDKYGYRILISMIGLCTAMLGMILIVALPLITLDAWLGII
jgi:MFS family permease